VTEGATGPDADQTAHLTNRWVPIRYEKAPNT